VAAGTGIVAETSDQAVFIGGPVMTLDAKGRLAVPARHLEPLRTLCGGHMVVCKHSDGCLWLFPQPVWGRFQAQILDWPSELDTWRRFYLGSANPLEIDGSSRVLLPPELREWAGLERDVAFMGIGATFQLWDAAKERAREVTALSAGKPEAVRRMVVR
jgi:MraZ protein